VERRLPLGVQNYDGDVQSDTVAQGYGSLGLMTSVLMSPDGKRSRPRRHTYRDSALPAAPARQAHFNQPHRLDFRLDARAIFRGRMDGTPDVVRFAETLEKVCVDVVESGKMTKDLAILIRPDHPFLSTDEFMARWKQNSEGACTDGSARERRKEASTPRLFPAHKNKRSGPEELPGPKTKRTFDRGRLCRPREPLACGLDVRSLLALRALRDFELDFCPSLSVLNPLI